jgi:hypothetical protein
MRMRKEKGKLSPTSEETQGRPRGVGSQFLGGNAS